MDERNNDFDFDFTPIGLATLGSNGGFVYGLYRAFDCISGFYISH